MEYKQLQEKYNRCCQLVTSEKLHDAFIILRDLAEYSNKSDLKIQLDNYKETYHNILKYSFGEIEDPKKKEVYYRLLRNVIELADEVYESVIVAKNLLHYSKIKNDYKNLPENIKLLTESYRWDPNITMNKTGTIDEEIDTGLLQKEHKKELNKLFTIFWLTDTYRDAEITLASDFINSENYYWPDKCLIITAIILSLQRHFDETKLNILSEAYKHGGDQVWQRALIGMLITLYQYNNRIKFYPKILKLLDKMHSDINIEKHVEAIIIQFIKTRDTEKIAQKFREEIIPEMTRIHSRIYDKLNMKELLQDPLSDDKNPDWEHVFHDSPGLINKLEELSMLQMEGSDVMLSTFSMLKQFDFFNTLSNWFVPFYKENSDMLYALKDDSGSFDAGKFATGMEKSSILCDSDKHSFCLNINRMPAKERSMMVEMFTMEMKAMEEMADDDELLNKPTHERVVFTHFIQDLYRFNKLYFYKKEFFDIFSTRTDFHNSEFFARLVTDESIVRNIGEFFFEKGHYQDAIEVFMKIDTTTDNFELWQKIAYSWQKLGNYENALEFYLKADLADIRKPWNIKKIALCYRRLGNDSKALDYYLDAEKLEPENLQIQANIAHIYFDRKDFEKAMNIYFKIEYLAPDNNKIQRPIAWCAFMLGKLDIAKKYFEKILEIEGSRHDLLNLGHIEWCLRNKQKAIERYQQSITKAENNFDWFADEFIGDSEILIGNGIDPVDVSLMRDYMKILMEQR